MTQAKGKVTCRIAAAAVAGTRHLEEGLPCQDYAVASRGRKICGVALADGAGSARHSELGAKVVVTDVLKLLRTRFDELLQLDLDAMAERIVGRLRQSLENQARRKSVEFHDLASTLLFSVTDGEQYLCGQIGDGRIAMFDASLVYAKYMFEPHKGEFFNQTSFVTSRGAILDMHLARGILDDIGGFALMSDGAEECLFNRADQSFAPALSRMMGWFDSHSERRIRSALSSNLEKTLRDRTGDDLSLALMRIKQVSLTVNS